MYDVHFNLNGMQILYRDCLTTENKLQGSSKGLFDLSNGIFAEISAFDGESYRMISNIDNQIAAVRSMIDSAERKKTSVQSKTQQELPAPPPPSVPAKATAEERSKIMNAYEKNVQQIERANSQIRNDNARIEAFVRKCDSTIVKLKDLISHLYEIKSLIEKERLHVLSEAKGYADKIKNDIRLLTPVKGAIQQFLTGFHNTIQDAVAIATMNPSKIEPYYYTDKQFEIKNHHGHIFGSGAAFFKSSSNATSVSNSKDISDTLSVNDELLISDREEYSFFDKIENASRIKMPSANLHKLGGKAFIAKMKEQGYSLQNLSNGRVIDDSGMMHWKKQDE